MAQDDPFGQMPTDRTLIIPSPGARAASPAPAWAPSLGGGGRFERVELGALDWDTGLNPLVAAATPLLNLVPQLRQATHPDPSGLRDMLGRAVQEFENRARARGALNEHVVAGRYALCTFLDETAANTPWGEKIWAQRSLLVQFHNEAWGGEKVFQLLAKVAEQPEAHRPLLELFYLILSLGFEGRYRVLQNGRAQLDQVRERLSQMLAKARGEPDRELSPAWRTTATSRTPLRDSVPIWAVAAIAALVLALVFTGLSFALNRRSDPTFSDILALNVKPPAAVVTKQVEIKAPDRLSSLLQDDIKAGRIVVRDLSDRSIVTALGDGVFEPGSATLAPSFVEILDRVGAAVAKVGGAVLVRGHTDNRPIRSARFPSNWHLSKSRADAVGEALAPKIGSGQRIQTEGRAESEPVASNESVEGRAQNRRVEIIVFPAAGGV
ncbi:DotU family type VI secretion system protein [Niveibacterium umoris]|uniref:Type VI secretion system protein ImpK n=1 Tax=Niveibacterium umoris TaxID=1193620 RepID=A0A840BG80_9RHOO|nr:DotU family type VI secretion system protein [Niveibacterium umoris]MBB4011673.1 type VI secretion system protein ImpK [Niveibacterium umoris]